MENHRPKILIIIPCEDISHRVKKILERKDFKAQLHFGTKECGFVNQRSFNLVIFFFQNPQRANSENSTYRALYLCLIKDSEHTIFVEEDGLYDFTDVCNLERNVEKIISHTLKISQKSSCSLPGDKTPANLEKKGKAALSKIVGKSLQIKRVKELIRHISQFPGLPVLITGETGTGKELVVDALHAYSSRANKPFIKINCCAIPETLLESQLFGHRKGAFSGATYTQKGLIEETSEGMLFLDEISSLKLELQPKLLRFLEDGSYLPVGEKKVRKSNAWIIAATNHNLTNLVEKGLFRADLFYRLKSTEIELPLLRERRADILSLAQFFLKKYSHEFGIKPKHLSWEVQEMLMDYDWPGNVRELRNVLRSAMITVKEDIISTQNITLNVQPCADNKPNITLTLAEMQRQHINQIYRMTGYNNKRTAKLLGIGLNTLKRKLNPNNGICKT